MYIPDEHLDFPLGFGIFWEVIVPRILEITEHIGCQYLYLFAADHTEQEIAKLRENREAVWQEYSDISGHY